MTAPGRPRAAPAMTDTVHDETPLLLGERVFSDADQQWFAAASGDGNPMHVDAVAARRLLSGRQVVHGMHTLVQALELWRPTSGLQPRQVKCCFDTRSASATGWCSASARMPGADRS